MLNNGKSMFVFPEIVFFIIGVIVLFFYSFTQVDLNLTLSEITLVSALQGYFQYVGYFERPLSTFWYVGALFLLFVSYFLIVRHHFFSVSMIKSLKKIIIVTSLLLTFSYPAFSYDIYNYMFDARIVTKYNQNPYERKALDYPNDPWVNFMRWTHRTYPYGPVWLALTVPLSSAGFEKFVPTLLLFKALMAASYVGACYFIYRILLHIKHEKAIQGALLFSLNPLVIIESLISGHNDIVMVSFALGSILFLLKKQYLVAVLLLILSIGLKFATVFLVPAYIYAFYSQLRGKKVDTTKFFIIAALAMLGAVIAASMRTQFQPWYLLYVFPFLSLLITPSSVRLMFIMGISALLLYVPYLYVGDWNPPIPTILNSLVIGGVVLSCVSLCLPLVTRSKSLHIW